MSKLLFKTKCQIWIFFGSPCEICPFQGQKLESPTEKTLRFQGICSKNPPEKKVPRAQIHACAWGGGPVIFHCDSAAPLEAPNLGMLKASTKFLQSDTDGSYKHGQMTPLSVLLFILVVWLSGTTPQVGFVRKKLGDSVFNHYWC